MISELFNATVKWLQMGMVGLFNVGTVSQTLPGMAKGRNALPVRHDCERTPYTWQDYVKFALQLCKSN